MANVVGSTDKVLLSNANRAYPLRLDSRVRGWRCPVVSSPADVMYVNAGVTDAMARYVTGVTRGRDLRSFCHIFALRSPSLIIASVVVVRVAVVPIKGITIKSIISEPSPKATPTAEASTLKTAGKMIESAAAETSEPAVKSPTAMRAAAPRERFLSGQYQSSCK
jgi:uncharacterized membrane-anchored protein